MTMIMSICAARVHDPTVTTVTVTTIFSEAISSQPAITAASKPVKTLTKWVMRTRPKMDSSRTPTSNVLNLITRKESAKKKAVANHSMPIRSTVNNKCQNTRTIGSGYAGLVATPPRSSQRQRQGSYWPRPRPRLMLNQQRRPRPKKN